MVSRKGAIWVKHALSVMFTLGRFLVFLLPVPPESEAGALSDCHHEVSRVNLPWVSPHRRVLTCCRILLKGAFLSRIVGGNS